MWAAGREMRAYLLVLPLRSRIPGAAVIGAAWWRALVQLITPWALPVGQPTPERQWLVSVIDQPACGAVGAPCITARALAARPQWAERLYHVVVCHFGPRLPVCMFFVTHCFAPFAS
ncbi:hypothetical protein [Actinomadura sp. 7K507]|uniref:hypothetical protein n=1 Tax=Actinomadura sp. 7K507 TaxID=2530365 RepID=UPI0010445E39|nr:hypothetical protein [Actinomadura sp. 7K507]TDC79890.1 hypothetical protein E1285_35560 [Actinomadura sp. 7K507]